MGDYTPNYNLYKPSVGENGWGKKFRENLDTIDSMIENTKATDSKLGVVKVGTGLNVASDGTVTLDTHASTHATGGTDAITPASIGAEPTIATKNTAFNVNFGTVAGTACQGNDSRLTNARTPTAHASTHASDGSDPITIAASQIGSGTIAIARIPTGSTSSTVCIGNDSRLSDARTPTTHASTHASGGTDAISIAASQVTSGQLAIARIPTGSTASSVCIGNDSRLSDARSPTAHASTHASDGSDPITIAASQIGSGTIAIARIPTGSTSSTVCIGNDSRLSDARTPTTHASTHASGGTDAISIAASQVTSGQLAIARIPTGSTASSVCIGNDSRLSDARSPTAHASTHASDGDDAITPASIGAEPVISTKNTAFNVNFGTTAGTACEGDDSRLTNARTPTTHASTHASDGSDPITIAASQIGSGTIAIARIPTGTTSSTVCLGSDTRLNNARTPTTHASTHASGGTDAISIAASQITSGTIAYARIPIGTAASTVCAGDDSRLSNARTPTAHNHAASDVTSGVFDIARIPAAAVERLVTVANDTARFALTTDDVQNGDSVYVTATQKLYIVIDDTQLNVEAGYMQYRAYVSWDSIDNKPSSYTPSTHASTHATGGTDAITPASIGAEPVISTKNDAFNVNFGTTAGTACQGNDSRLSNSRTPTTHASTHASDGSDPITIAASQIGSGTIAIARIPTGSTSSTVCIGNDSRLSDARTPTTHASTHASGGTDAISIAASQITSGTIAYARIPIGTAASTVCAGNDSRLSDARTPTAHNHSGADITSGTVSASYLPVAGTNTLGVIQITSSSGLSINSSGVLSCGWGN